MKQLNGRRGRVKSTPNATFKPLTRTLTVVVVGGKAGKLSGN